jgi:hypothetical protein
MAANATHSSDQPALRMVLNLTRILPTPYFRSYWIQQNITELKHYSAALSDLYLAKQDFREERVLLPNATGATVPTVDLAPILQYLPINAGVYRATAHPTTDQTLDALNEKLLARTASSFHDQHLAPVVDLNVRSTGSATDFETRIDTPPIPEQPITVALAPLRSLLDAAPLDALLIYSSTTSQPVTDSFFLPIHTAVILSASTPFVPTAIQAALTQDLSARLTVSTASLNWKTRQEGSVTYFQLSGLETLTFSVQGKFCILASDPETLLQILGSPHQKSPQPFIATTAAGFNHTAERSGLNRLSSLLDRTNTSPQSDVSTPAFFSRNMGGISQTFQSLDSESFTETVQAQPNAVHIVNQRVIYTWHP